MRAWRSPPVHAGGRGSLRRVSAVPIARRIEALEPLNALYAEISVTGGSFMGLRTQTPAVDQFDCGGGFPLVSECRRRIFREWRQLSDAIAALSTNALKQSS